MKQEAKKRRHGNWHTLLVVLFALDCMLPKLAYATVPIPPGSIVVDPIESAIQTAIDALEKSDLGQMISGLGSIFSGVSNLTSKLEDDLGITALIQSLSARVKTMAQLQAEQAAIDNARLTAEAAKAAKRAADNAISVSAAQKYCNEMMAKKAMSYGQIMEATFSKIFSTAGNNVDRLPGTNGNSPTAATGALVPAGCASFMGTGVYRGLPFQVNCTGP